MSWLQGYRASWRKGDEGHDNQSIAVQFGTVLSTWAEWACQDSRQSRNQIHSDGSETESKVFFRENNGISKD